MKLIVLQIYKKYIFAQKIKYPSYSFYMTLTLVLGIDENIIQIHNDKNIKLLGPDLIDITLEAG